MSDRKPTCVGNVEDKYHTRNPVSRWLVRRFLRTLGELYGQVQARTVLEVGCGEGHLARELLRCGRRPQRFEACDISLERLAPPLDSLIRFREASIYQLPYADEEFELVVCCEVLEHLDDPAAGLSELARLAGRAVLVSTPCEPLWRVLNMLRGRYVRDLGNTPGHVQHFSRHQLIELVAKHLRIVCVRNPLPWTAILGCPIRA